jgi:hypothetical protein
VVAVGTGFKSDVVSIKEPCGFDEAESVSRHGGCMRLKADGAPEMNPKGCAQLNEHFTWRRIPPTTKRQDCGQPANIRVRHTEYRIDITLAVASSSKTGGKSSPPKDPGGPSSQKKPSKKPKRSLEEEMSTVEDLDDEPGFHMYFSA